MTRFASGSADETIAIGTSLGKDLRAGSVVCLEGSLGAGKTVLAKGIARGLGIAQTVTSPTFTILSVYEDGRLPLHHFDLYRISHPEELEMLGFREILYGSGVTLIEWSERADELPDERITVRIAILGDGKREIVVEGPEGTEKA